MCSQETRTRVQRTFAILVSAEIEGSVAIGSYYLLLFPLWIILWARHCAVWCPKVVTRAGTAHPDAFSSRELLLLDILRHLEIADGQQ